LLSKRSANRGAARQKCIKRSVILYAQKEYPMNATVLKIVLVLFGALAAQPESKAQQHFDIPKGMKSYFVGFLVRGDKSAQTVPKEELDQLMRTHLA
jgi:hypothetical protein